MSAHSAIVIGAGIGGLAAAIMLAQRGVDVTVCERAADIGGKMRETQAGASLIDAGPTVLTMRWVFDALFEGTGTPLEAFVTLRKLGILARHAWSGDATLDLFADEAASADAIGAFAGAKDARGFRSFCREARRMYETLRLPFLAASKPTPLSLMTRLGPARLGDLIAIRPFESMWSALGAHFSDPRLRQLFGRYATYCGSSPFTAPATLMLIAHVEQDGVWIVEGGMRRLAEGLRRCAEQMGVRFRFNAHVSTLETRANSVTAVRLDSGERIGADCVLCNGDPAALMQGLFGDSAARALKGASAGQRSLSAVTWVSEAVAQGLPLVRHNVFFSDDYRAEFNALEASHAPAADPTIYICAQDRDDSGLGPKPERMLILANAAARGDRQPLTPAELKTCETNMINRLRRCGLDLSMVTQTVTTPAQFEMLFPATGGALYGRAMKGWAAPFQRPGSRTKLRNLYLAGGGVHPGPGVPMAALSGQLAAQSMIEDLASMRTSRAAGMPGGTSTRSAMTNSTA